MELISGNCTDLWFEELLVVMLGLVLNLCEIMSSCSSFDHLRSSGAGESERERVRERVAEGGVELGVVGGCLLCLRQSEGGRMLQSQLLGVWRHQLSSGIGGFSNPRSGVLLRSKVSGFYSHEIRD